MPQQRAKVERFLQTLDVRALLRFSGRAFSNPVVRGKYESAARACVTVPELAALVVRFIVDEYHNVEHAGLGGETPRSVWLRLSKKYAPTAPPGPSRIRRAFGEDYAVVLQAQGIQIFGNWYTSRATDDLFQKVGDREYTVRVDSEDLGAVSLRVPGGWLTLLGPDVMKGVSVAVWEAALADLRRQNQDLQDLVRPVVHRAIAFAQMADAETRKRLSILYRPKSGPELEALRRRMNATVRHRQEILAPQARPIDILADPIPVGRKASTRTIRPAGARDAGPRPNPVEPEPKRPRRRRKSPTAPKHAEPQRKPPRPWKIRKR